MAPTRALTDALACRCILHPQDFSKYGRVEYFLQQRLRLLNEVQRLAYRCVRVSGMHQRPRAIARHSPVPGGRRAHAAWAFRAITATLRRRPGISLSSTSSRAGRTF